MIGLQRHTVQVVPHHPDWLVLATETCQQVRLAGSDLFVDVQHIGSTAVPGLPAKPILDLMAGVRTLDKIPEVTRCLTGIGYLISKEGGDAERHLFLRESAPDIRTIHLHVVEYDGTQWKECLCFRDRLRQDARVRNEYAELKQHLAEKFRQDRKAYTDSKNGFIRGLLRSCLSN